MKFVSWIEYNMRYTFLQKSCWKCEEETSLKSFLKKPKISMSLDQQSEVSYSLFLLHAKHFEIKMLTTCFYFIQSFSNTKKRSITTLPDLFSP